MLEKENKKGKKEVIEKRAAAREVAFWVSRLALTGLIGIVLAFLAFAIMLYEGYGYVFIITAGEIGFFGWMAGVAMRHKRYLQERYGI